MSEQWTRVERQSDPVEGFVSNVKWIGPMTHDPNSGYGVNPGEDLIGYIVSYDPDVGDRDIERREAGHVHIKVTEGKYEGEVLGITLPKSPKTGSSVIRDEFRGVPDPKLGQYVRTHFLGLVEPKRAGGQKYNDFHVFTVEDKYNPEIVAEHNLQTV